MVTKVTNNNIKMTYKLQKNHKLFIKELKMAIFKYKKANPNADSSKINEIKKSINDLIKLIK